MKKEVKTGTLVPFTVTEGLTVTILPSSDYEFLMTTKEVANGYGVTEYAIRKNKLSFNTELIEGKHFVTAVTIGNGKLQSAFGIPHNSTLWTKRGIVRLGFTMRGERAKLFRDWAEELIIKIDEQRDLFGASASSERTLPKKRNHNRLTSERLIRLLRLTHRIDNVELRNEIVEQLMGEQ